MQSSVNVELSTNGCGHISGNAETFVEPLGSAHLVTTADGDQRSAEAYLAANLLTPETSTTPCAAPRGVFTDIAVDPSRRQSS